MDPKGSNIVSTVRNGWLICLFELFGCIFLGIFQPYLAGGMLMFALWPIYCICEPISGAHFNPAITITYMVRED